MGDENFQGTLRMPGGIHFGYGTRELIPAAVRAQGERTLLVVDPFLAASPLVREVHDAVLAAGARVRVFSAIVPELPVDSLSSAAGECAAFAPDSVLTIGGGSAMDAAKVLALLLTHGGPLSRYYGENRIPGPVIPIIAVPTTAGTGSEVTPVSVVSDAALGAKVGVSSPHLVPVTAIVDPEFTLGAPGTVTAHSGIDALVHAIESFTARSLPLDYGEVLPLFTGRNALIDPVALSAMSRLHRWVPTAAAEPSNRRARAEAALGALQAGIAFGPTGTHLCHALQYPIGALTKTPHGLGTGLLLPYALARLIEDPATNERVAEVGQALTGERDAQAAVAAVHQLNERLSIPRTLADIGISSEDLPALVDRALSSSRLMAICPVEPDRELLLDVLRRAHSGARAA